MKNKKLSPKRKSNRSVSTTVIVAIIGFLGTLVAALVGLYATNLQVKQPILATQTAQAVLSPTAHNQNIFADVLDVNTYPLCGTPIVVPKYVDPFKDANKALLELSDIHDRGDYLPSAPAGHSNFETGEFILDGSIDYFVSITSKAPTEWIKLGNKAKITIMSQKTDEGPVNTFTAAACGAESNFRDFSLEDNLFDTKYPSYTLNATYQNADFFTLEPGEFEILTFRLQCGKPGIYQIQFEIPVEYQGETGSVLTSAGAFLCPSQVGYWVGQYPLNEDLNTGLISLQGTYKWDGSHYIWEQP